MSVRFGSRLVGQLFRDRVIFGASECTPSLSSSHETWLWPHQIFSKWSAVLNLCFERDGGKREEEIEVWVDEVMSPQRYLHTNVTSHGKGDFTNMRV